MSIVNIAGYQFVNLGQLEDLRQALLEVCQELSLYGTILLAPEGTNQMLAGSRQAIDQYYAYLQQHSPFKSMGFKESFSPQVPFQQLFVKIKKEIIPMGVENIDPLCQPAPYVSPQQLKQWLDEGRELVLLDTRNRYEIEHGTFAQATHLNMENFRDFVQSVESIEDKDKIYVTFCTGGIRCEKAAPLMQQKGFEQVYQLEGGILKYFEECGGAHYEGQCFVFDERIALNPELKPVAFHGA